MTIIELQLMVSFQVLIWFDWLKPHHLILKALGFQIWTPKHELPFIWQWLGCYFCTSFWIGVVNAIVIQCLYNHWQLSVMLIMSNLVASRLLDYLLGYQSFKP